MWLWQLKKVVDLGDEVREEWEGWQLEGNTTPTPVTVAPLNPGPKEGEGGAAKTEKAKAG